jgi:hypothetical protein
VGKANGIWRYWPPFFVTDIEGIMKDVERTDPLSKAELYGKHKIETRASTWSVDSSKSLLLECVFERGKACFLLPLPDVECDG